MAMVRDGEKVEILVKGYYEEDGDDIEDVEDDDNGDE